MDILPTEFAACSKSPSRDNYRKASYPRAQQHDRVGVETRSCDQGRRKNDAFIHLATLPTKWTCHNELALFSPMVSVEMKEEMRMSILNYKDSTITTRTGLEFGE